MSDITIENLEEQSENIITQIGENALINWEKVKASQQELLKGFEFTTQHIFSLRDNLQKNFLTTLKDLKQLDAKDLLKQLKEKKILNAGLKHLLPYAQRGQDSVITLDIELIKKDAIQKEEQFTALNKKITEKLFETAKWIEDQIKNMTISKEGEKKPTEVVQTTKQEEDKNQVEDLKKFSFSQDKINDIVSNIKVIQIPDTNQLISIKTYAQIVENSVELAEEEFIRVTFDNRKERREIMHTDHKRYVKLMMDHMNDIENLLMKAQEDICQKLGISQECLEQSEMVLMERGLGQHIFMMQASVRQKIKDKLPKKKQVGAKITKDIIKYQIKLLNDKQELFKPILQELPQSYETTQLIPIILNLVINDLVFEEYNFEEEDYMQNLNDQNAFKDQEVMELLKGIEQGIFCLLTNCGLIPKGQGMPPQQFGQNPMGGMGGMQGFNYPGMYQ